MDIDINEMLEEKNFKATKLPNQIVQLVFACADMDRRLVSKYATVLNKFIETEQSESKFTSWLTKNGGVNGVMLTWQECETEYNAVKTVECYQWLL